MNRVLLTSSFLLSFLLLSCSSASDSSTETALRINYWEYSLGMTHNSHLGRSFSNEFDSFTVTGTFRIYLSDLTQYEDIYKLRIADDALRGWVFDATNIAEAYDEESNSLVFEQLSLHRLDFISGKVLAAEILDENNEVIFKRSASMNNELPLPALSSLESPSGSQLDMRVNFYETPYQQGNIPFPIKVYPTYFSSNAFSVVWLDNNKVELDEISLDLGNLNPAFDPNPDDIYSYLYSSDNIPNGASYFYLKLRRGRTETGRVLYTEILELP